MRYSGPAIKDLCERGRRARRSVAAWLRAGAEGQICGRFPVCLAGREKSGPDLKKRRLHVSEEILTRRTVAAADDRRGKIGAWSAR